jgi:hypothetical protein
MKYLFKGNLAAWICNECRESLSKVKVKLYDVKDRPNVTALVAANAKDTLYVDSNSQLLERKSLLLGEGTTDENGFFSVQLDEKKYQGGAVEIAVYCESVPGQKENKEKPKPVEFVITTVQPLWRELKNELVFTWEYILPYRFWCYILSLFDIWVICGKVVYCQNPRIPIVGAEVTAMDADWITDDLLGTATTNSLGYFKIYYTSKDFKKTFLSPIINVETPFPPFNSGPDVYFKVRSSGGTLLINETRVDGQNPARSNIGNCFCIVLCVSKIPDEEETPQSAWTGIGTQFTIPTGADLNSFDANGYAGTQKFSFTSTIRMTGQSPKEKNGHPVEYRFLVSKTTGVNGAALLPAANFTLVVGKDPGLFAETKIGQMLKFTPTFKIVNIYVKQVDFDSDGWLDVNKSIVRTFTSDPSLDPAELSIPGLWNWIDLDGMMAINTNALTSAANVSLAGKKAGDTIPPAEQIPIEKIAIRFEAREVINKTALIFNYLPGSGQTLNAMVVNNNVDVKLLAIKEHLSLGFCSPLSGDVHVVYTAYHPHLQNVLLYIRKNSDPGWTALPGDGMVPLSNNTNAGVTILNNSAGILIPAAMLPTSCTYIVLMTLLRRLHTGDDQVSTEWVDTSFYYQK